MATLPASTSSSGEPTCIRVRGARTHNLANIDLDIPRGKLVVLTGPSGSGKSSLAFHTLFAEGQRRYVESLSASARQFLAQLPKPDADLIEGLSPTIAIDQGASSRNPRSTVGTTTEVHDFLRLLYARIGEVYSDRTGALLRRFSVEDMLAATLAWPLGTRFSVLAPVIRGQPGNHAEVLAELRRQGFIRAAIDGTVHDLGDDITLDPAIRHTIDVYVDRLVLKDGIRARLADSFEVALRLADGIVKVAAVDGPELVFSERHADLEHGIVYPELTPSLFSFNSPDGACPTCDGLGSRRTFDPQRIVGDPQKSLKAGALAVWSQRSKAHDQALTALAKHYKFSLSTPWAKLPEEIKVVLLHGSGTEDIPGLGKRPTRFDGVIPWLERRLHDSDANEPDDETNLVDEIETLRHDAVCPDCHGQRLRREARMVKVGGHTISEVTAWPVDRLLPFLMHLQSSQDLGRECSEIAGAILGQAQQRLQCMQDLGLGYLTLDRPTTSLSGGELQRIRLATQIGATLVGVTYILDEPSIGLHQRDNERLIAALLRLRDLGNTVIVVEHDEDTIRAADYIIDMGPGAGVHGGQVIAAGTLPELLANRRSRTAAYLGGRTTISAPTARRPGNGGHLGITEASGHNLKQLTVKIPLGTLTCVAGVSGSGKSTLILDTLLPEATRALHGARGVGLPHRAISGLGLLDKVIHVDQSPLGRSPRSNPATYTGIFSELRSLYANLPESRIRGFAPARFSFNVKGGRCEACLGDGVRRIEMHFLPDVFVTCRACAGRRYNRETLAVTYRGKSIADVLALPISTACEFFANHPGLRHKLETLRDVGLGYLTLGQSALSLSGGEAQRIKLARELAKKSTGKTLFILDEPTTGLHFGDIEQLLKIFDRLVDEGNTVIVIEHNLDVLKCADYIIDIGPEGGDAGGHLVAHGTPEHVAATTHSATGRFLAAKLGVTRRAG